MTIPFAEAVTRRRYAAGTTSGGRRVKGAVTTSTIQASIQPVKGEQMERLPEGVRRRVTMVAYTEDDLRTVNQAAGLDADEIVYGGVTYVVDHIASWPTVLPHIQAYLTRRAESGGAP